MGPSGRRRASRFRSDCAPASIASTLRAGVSNAAYTLVSIGAVGVEVLAEAELELDVLLTAERGALLNALEKLRRLGPALGAPH